MMTRHVETLYCDDIRHEIGGKLSFIGVYSTRLFVQSFPALLPKLCLSIKVMSPAEGPLRQLNLQVLKDDDVLQAIAPSEEELIAACDLVDGMTEEERRTRAQIAQFLVVFSPIQFDGPCTLKVHVTTENETLRGASLMVSTENLEPGQRQES